MIDPLGIVFTCSRLKPDCSLLGKQYQANKLVEGKLCGVSSTLQW